MERFRGRGDGATRPPLAGCVFGAGVLAAPFLAFLYGPNPGLAVMALALGTTTAFGAHAARGSSPDVRRRLLPIVILNGVLVIVCVAVLAVRLIA